MDFNVNYTDKSFIINERSKVTAKSFDNQGLEKPYQLIFEVEGKDDDDFEISYRARFEYPTAGNRDEKYSNFDQNDAQKFYDSALKFIYA